MSTSGLVADSGTLWVAPVGTTLPTNVATAMGTVDAAWINVGKLGKDGLGLTSDPQIAELFSFGFTDPTRTRKTREVKQFTANLQEWNTASFTLAFNGGTVTVATGIATYVPVADTTLVGHAIVLEVEDGTSIYRLVIAEAEVRSGLQMNFSDEDYTVLPLAVTILQPDSGAAWKLVTNDTAFVVTS
jgi:hypothetical protein